MPRPPNQLLLLLLMQFSALVTGAFARGPDPPSSSRERMVWRPRPKENLPKPWQRSVTRNLRSPQASRIRLSGRAGRYRNQFSPRSLLVSDEDMAPPHKSTL